MNLQGDLVGVVSLFVWIITSVLIKTGPDDEEANCRSADFFYRELLVGTSCSETDHDLVTIIIIFKSTYQPSLKSHLA